MFKTFFSKLAITYIFIITAVISIFSYGTTLLYENDIFEDKKQNLLLASHEVQQLTKFYYDQEISKLELDRQLNVIGSITESKIYIIKMNKESLKNPESLQLDGLAEASILNDLEEVLNHKTIFRKSKYFKDMDTYVVMLGQPLFIESKMQGVILFLTPVSKLGSRITGIRLLVFVLASSMALIGITIIYFNARRLSKPIKHLEYAAMKLAMGDSPDDVEINSKDEIARLAKTFNYMKNRLTETEQMRRDFIANVSHDLKTPLTTINGFIQGMLDGLVKPENTRKYLEIINKETLRLMRLTGDILEISKLESGNIKIYREYVDMREVLEDICSGMEPWALEKSIELAVSCPYGIRTYVDEDRFKQILSNIMSNSLKYTNKGGYISVYADEQKDFVKVVVKDTGIGIPNEDLTNIFEKFYRVDKSRQTENLGTGLGLSIVKKLVELHGGTIHAKSEVSVGTEIIIEIPK